MRVKEKKLKVGKCLNKKRLCHIQIDSYFDVFSKFTANFTFSLNLKSILLFLQMYN